MAVTIVMPKLGQIMVEGIVNKWNKAPGDAVAEGDVIAEIETEKLNYDLEATGGGMFHPVVTEGTVVPVDGVLAYLLAEGESPPEPPTVPSPAMEPALKPSPLPRRPSRAAAPPPGRRHPLNPRRSQTGVQARRRPVEGHRHRAPRQGCRGRRPKVRGSESGDAPGTPGAVEVRAGFRHAQGHRRAHAHQPVVHGAAVLPAGSRRHRGPAPQKRGVGGQRHDRLGPRARQGMRRRRSVASPP